MLNKKQINEINARVDKGDKEAIKFMVAYPEMSEEEANAYLAKLAIDDEEPKDQSKAMNEFLIKDENEAINGYDKAILLDKNTGNDKALSVHQSIKEDELRHIKMLKDLDNSVEPKKEE